MSTLLKCALMSIAFGRRAGSVMRKLSNATPWATKDAAAQRSHVQGLLEVLSYVFAHWGSFLYVFPYVAFCSRCTSKFWRLVSGRVMNSQMAIFWEDEYRYSDWMTYLCSYATNVECQRNSIAV